MTPLSYVDGAFALAVEGLLSREGPFPSRLPLAQLPFLRATTICMSRSLAGAGICTPSGIQSACDGDKHMLDAPHGSDRGSAQQPPKFKVFICGIFNSPMGNMGNRV